VDAAGSELQAVRRALACVSHELNSSLQALFTFLKLVERDAPSRHLGMALTAAARLRDEIQAVAAAGAPPAREPVELGALVDQLGEGTQREDACAGAWVRGDARGLAALLRLLVQRVAATLPAGTRVPVGLEVDAAELRVRVGAPAGERSVVELGAARVGLAELVGGVVAALHGGRLERLGPAGETRFELVLPRAVRP
jgi:hypothetical protein